MANSVGLCPDAGSMHCATGDGLVYVEVSIADFDVEPAVRVRAGPGLEVDGSALAAEVG